MLTGKCWVILTCTDLRVLRRAHKSIWRYSLSQDENITTYTICLSTLFVYWILKLKFLLAKLHISAVLLIWGKWLKSDQMSTFTGEEVSIDKQVACEECPRWLKMTEVAWEEISCRYIFCILLIEIGSFHGYLAVLKSTNIIYALWNTLGRDSYPMHSKEPSFMYTIINFTVIFNDQPIITDKSLKYSN